MRGFGLIKFISVLMIAAVTAGCAAQPGKEQTSKLTVEEIKNNYPDEKILDIHELESRYVLVEVQRDTYANRFELYNLETGERDVLPTGVEYTEPHEIVNQNHVVLLATGRDSESSYQNFPYYKRFIKNSGVDDKDNSFICINEDRYLDIGEKTGTDSGKRGVLSAVIVGLESVEFLFKPERGKEAGFYAAFTDIPATEIMAEEDNSVMLVRFEDAAVEGAVGYNGILYGGDNPYFSRLEVREEDSGVSVYIHLTESAGRYLVKKGRLPLPTGFPYLHLEFRSGLEF
ncbi:MAG: hypothetical protein QME73_03360 [Bacillota bacterium]|nr:hypothetical protein [Bacillota bacterium]